MSVTGPTKVVSVDGLRFLEWLLVFGAAAEAEEFHAADLASPEPRLEATWAALQALAAFDDSGDRGPLRALFGRLTGHGADPLAITAFVSQLPGNSVEDLSARTFLLSLRSYAERSRRLREAEVALEWSEEVGRVIRQYPNVVRALNALRTRGQSREEALAEALPGLAYVARAELASLPPEEHAGPAAAVKAAHKVTSRLRREGVENPDRPGRVFAPGPEVLSALSDALEIDAFALREQLALLANDAALSRQELESWFFATRFGSDKEAAAELGRSANQIAQEKMRANRKFRRVV